MVNKNRCPLALSEVACTERSRSEVLPVVSCPSYKYINREEINKIKKLREQRKTIKEIANLLGRSVNSIRCFIHYYSLPDRSWTESENEILRNEYLVTPAKLLTVKLNRSRHSIYVQACKLGLRKNKKK